MLKHFHLQLLIKAAFWRCTELFLNIVLLSMCHFVIIQSLLFYAKNSKYTIKSAAPRHPLRFQLSKNGRRGTHVHQFTWAGISLLHSCTNLLNNHLQVCLSCSLWRPFQTSQTIINQIKEELFLVNFLSSAERSCLHMKIKIREKECCLAAFFPA